ncbi:glycosyltransferase [Haliea sp. E1-2-M8]|uniref:glycosyltransferase n=1 Tax=Haliea sp. E1-2-M8 TaxID=3064706 RepID=UPI0027167490|nr:glycosyltransferase [Haliea sp. E1-2-M8]MDO8860425.1 glycosyltransferase [Haliea sp. E1-2-M8]
MSRLLILTNLYPLPWEPNRGLFNRQQFSRLGSQRDLEILVPVAIGTWLRQVGLRNSLTQADIRYTWYFYTPRAGRSLYGFMMTLSLLLNSGLWIAGKRFDALLASWAYPDGYAGLWLARVFRLRFYLKVHGSDINVLADKGLRLQCIRRSCESAREVFAVSAALKTRIEEITEGRASVQVLYNGVDHGTFFPGSHRLNQLIFIGNLKRDKGIYELLAAFGAIASAELGLQLLIIGSGGEEAGLRDTIKTQGLAERVTLGGALPHDQVALALRQSRLLALPSYNEGVPNVVLEAMASGTPVVATRVGGIPEVVVDGETGFLCKARDVGSLARTLSRALAYSWSHEHIAAHSTRFSWSANIAALDTALG